MVKLGTNLYLCEEKKVGKCRLVLPMLGSANPAKESKRKTLGYKIFQEAQLTLMIQLETVYLTNMN